VKIHSRFLLVLWALAAFAVLGGCNSSPSGGEGAVARTGGSQVIGAGSTFVYPLMTRWIATYQQSHQGVQINYQSIGSGGGIQQLKRGLVDFGASDAALDDTQLKDMPPVVQIAESAGLVCVTYNLADLKQPLKLSGKTLAGIYLGTIKTWQDPAIKKDNPGVSLPKENIMVVHRSDGSGTTNIFTTYLAAISPEWDKRVQKGLSVSWPLGLGGKGSEGVTGLVKQNPGAISYVELPYAMQNQLPTAEIENQAGRHIAPTAESASATIDAFSQQLAADVRVPVTNPPASAANAYPISGLTFLLVPQKPADAQKGQQVKSFITFVITDGQELTGELHYAKLPNSLQEADKRLLDQMQ